MVDPGVVEVRISNKDVCVLSESSKLETNELKELIRVLRATQKSTNECLTKLTNDSQSESGDKSDDEDDVDDSEDDLSVDINDPDLSPKRAKLKN